MASIPAVAIRSKPLEPLISLSLRFNVFAIEIRWELTEIVVLRHFEAIDINFDGSDVSVLRIANTPRVNGLLKRLNVEICR